MMGTILKRKFGTQKLAATKRVAMRGAVAVEFAILLIPMLLMVLGVVEYGRALYQYNTLAKAVRDSTRLLAQNNPADADYPLADAKCLAVYGHTCTSDVTPLVPGLTTDMVYVCNPADSSACPGITYANVSTGSGAINLVEVRIKGYVFDYRFNPAVFFVPSSATTLNFGDIHTTMRQIL